MPVYLLTNRITHSRCTVIANDPEAAKFLHPTNDFAVRRPFDRGWSRERCLRGSGFRTYTEAVPPPDGWPLDLKYVHVTEIARDVDRNAPEGVLSYQNDMQLRQRGEGPDDTWGGYTLDVLRQFPAE